MVLRVLLVEDDPFQQMALSGIIARVEAENAQLTVQLKIAGTGDEALAALEAVESHLVLLDYKLPGGDAMAKKVAGWGVFKKNEHVCYVDPDANKGKGKCYRGKPTAVKALSTELAA